MSNVPQDCPKTRAFNEWAYDGEGRYDLDIMDPVFAMRDELLAKLERERAENEEWRDRFDQRVAELRALDPASPAGWAQDCPKTRAFNELLGEFKYGSLFSSVAQCRKASVAMRDELLAKLERERDRYADLWETHQNALRLLGKAEATLAQEREDYADVAAACQSALDALAQARASAEMWESKARDWMVRAEDCEARDERERHA